MKFLLIVRLEKVADSGLSVLLMTSYLIVGVGVVADSGSDSVRMLYWKASRSRKGLSWEKQEEKWMTDEA